MYGERVVVSAWILFAFFHDCPTRLLCNSRKTKMALDEECEVIRDFILDM